jgi:hypothetical protein
VSMIATNQNSLVLADATVELISKVYRPWLFRVTVTGKPPFKATRIYEIYGKSDSDAAFAGIARFEKEMSHPLSILHAI